VTKVTIGSNPFNLLLFVLLLNVNLKKTLLINYFTIFPFVTDIVLDVIKNVPAWPGRHLLEGGDDLRYFGLKTVMRGDVEFEVKSQREYEMWTQGVSRLLVLAAERKFRM